MILKDGRYRETIILGVTLLVVAILSSFGDIMTVFSYITVFFCSCLLILISLLILARIRTYLRHIIWKEKQKLDLVTDTIYFIIDVATWIWLYNNLVKPLWEIALGLIHKS